MKNRKNKTRGSALLIAILVMGVLLTLTVGLSGLVVHEITVTSDVINKGKAYYEAEAGIENGLLKIRDHLPGFECGLTPDNPCDPASQNNTAYDYKILNTADAYPYFDKDKFYYLSGNGPSFSKDDLYKDQAAATYNVLPLNQTVTIPLFIQGADGAVYDVHRFLIQYYVDFNIDPSVNKIEFKVQSSQLEKFDILRWKVFGQSQIDNVATGKTDSISDFFPANSQDSADTPVCIGSDPTMLSDNSNYHCLAPVEQLRYVQDANLDNTNKTVNLDNPSAERSNAEILGDTSSVWSQARECYARDVGYDMATKAVVGLAVLSASGNVDIIKDCSIGGFVQNHTKNYITLTNVVNPDIIGITDPVLRAKKANIYYRVIAEPDVATGGNTNGPNVLPREYAEIKADGYAGKTKQSIDVQYKLNSFLPVFNFSLYKTDTSKSDTDSSNNVGLGSLN